MEGEYVNEERERESKATRECARERMSHARYNSFENTKKVRKIGIGRKVE